MAKIDHEEEYELYHYGESLCSQMVRVALAEKEVPYKSHHMFIGDISTKGTNLTEAYLKINPKAVVPTLIHHGEPLRNSYEIMQYLDDKNKEKGARLWPDDAKAREEVEGWVQEAALRDDVPLGKSFGTSIPALSAGILSYLLRQQPFFHVWWKYRNHPIRIRKVAFRLMRILGGLPKGLVKGAAEKVAQSLRSIEDTLQDGREWILKDFSQVDVMLMCHFHRLEDVGLGDLFDAPSLPKTKAYWDRLQARPSYQAGVLDWHDEEYFRVAIKNVLKGKPSPYLPKILDHLK